MILDAEHLSAVSWITAAAAGGLAFLFLIRPDSLSRFFAALPRHRTGGKILCAGALIWSALLMDQMTLGDLSKYKWLLYLLTPLSFFLITQFLDELLAARALGGLLMLAPTLMVDAARWHPSASRLVVVTLAYVMVVAGIWLVLSPHKFRIWTNGLMASPGRRSGTGVVLAVLAGLLVFTAVRAA